MILERKYNKLIIFSKIVIAIFMELCQKFATKTLADACVKMDTLVLSAQAA